jgi:hypothetical protein
MMRWGLHGTARLRHPHIGTIAAGVSGGPPHLGGFSEQPCCSLELAQLNKRVMSDGVQLGLPVFGVVLSLVVELEEIED